MIWQWCLLDSDALPSYFESDACLQQLNVQRTKVYSRMRVGPFGFDLWLSQNLYLLLHNASWNAATWKAAIERKRNCCESHSLISTWIYQSKWHLFLTFMPLVRWASTPSPRGLSVAANASWNAAFASWTGDESAARRWSSLYCANQVAPAIQNPMLRDFRCFVPSLSTW